MAEIHIGDVQISSDGNTLNIASRSQPDIMMSLDAAGVEELIDFVTSLTGSEFNRRQNFRVPLHRFSGLSVEIRKDDKQFSVTPRNISVTGVFIELHPDDWLDLSQGDDIEVILEFEGETLTYHGIVRRCDENGYGLCFRESINGEQIEPPPEISRVVMELQRRWISRRNNSARNVK